MGRFYQRDAAACFRAPAEKDLAYAALLFFPRSSVFRSLRVRVVTTNGGTRPHRFVPATQPASMPSLRLPTAECYNEWCQNVHLQVVGFSFTRFYTVLTRLVWPCSVLALAWPQLAAGV